jgi:hypothetical protein
MTKMDRKDAKRHSNTISSSITTRHAKTFLKIDTKLLNIDQR